MVLARNELLERALLDAKERGASDVHLLPGEPVTFRVDGQIVRGDGPVLGAREVSDLVHAAVGADRAARVGHEVGFVTGQCGIEGVISGHLCVTRSLGDYAATIRILLGRVLSPEQVAMPAALLEAAGGRAGVIVITGPIGSGKTTTAISLVGHISATRAVNIVTIEDPVSVRFTPMRSIVRQQEVGTDVPGFHEALRGLLPQDPDVLYLSDARDAETLEACVTAAELGALVIVVLHVDSPEGAIERVAEAVPADAREAFRRRLAAVLRVASAQKLLPTPQGQRVAAYGVLVADEEMREAIRSGRSVLMRRSPLPAGSRSLAEDVRRLVAEGKAVPPAE